MDGALRVSCLGLTGMVLLVAVFHALLWIGLFRTWAVLGLLSLLSLLVHRTLGYGLGALRRDLRRDRRMAFRVARLFLLRWRARSALHWLVLVIPLALWVRVTFVPPLSWDVLTSHGVKAALWVQRGGPIAFDMEGPWSITRFYPAGGEIFWAYAMLPFHGDLLVGWVDLAEWLLLGVVIYACAAQLGVRARHRPAAVFYVLFLPVVCRLVGDGYQELACNAVLLGAMAMGLRFARTGELRFLGFSTLLVALAPSIKVASLPAAGLLAVALLVAALTGPGRRGQALGAYVLGGLAGLVLVLPWVIENILRTGYPLAYIPARVMGLALGTEHPTMQLFLHRPELAGFSFHKEWLALEAVFESSFDEGSHLGRATLLPLVLATLAVAFGMARMPRRALLLLAVGAGTVFFVYQDGFKVVRLLWPFSRFLIALVAVAAVGSMRLVSRRRWLGPAYACYLSVFALVHGALGLGYAFSAREWHVLLALLIGGALLAATSRVLRWRPTASARAVAAVATLLGVIGLIGLDRLRADTRHHDVLAHRDIEHLNLFWAPLAEAVDHPAQPHTLAVTAGEHPNADNIFFYYFLGTRLQNRLVYVASQPRTPQREAFVRWCRGLREAGASHVVSLWPPSPELPWLEGHPELFRRLAGEPGQEGLFAMKGGPCRP
ncbi:MAG: hypothetical protein PVI30_04740 [Myxococcales bacterium]